MLRRFGEESIQGWLGQKQEPVLPAGFIRAPESHAGHSWDRNLPRDTS